MKNTAIFVGTRPEIIKMAPVVQELNSLVGYEVPFIHTGQHYDWEMSERFFKELQIPEPSEFLGVGSGSQGQQLSKVVATAEACLLNRRVELALVEGDTNSALGVALAASKNNVKLAHVEAGCRSFDKRMPEEINRVLITDCADLNFAPTENCYQNLRTEGIPRNRLYLTGHPLVTLIDHVKGEISHSGILKQLRLSKGKFVLATVHRQENVDKRTVLRQILESLSRLPTTTVLPLHPRSKMNSRRFRLTPLLRKIHTISPLGYMDTLRLIRDAEAVITDSGGIQQEAFLLGTPCLTIRKSTEWIETIKEGGNFLVKDPKMVGKSFSELRKNRSQIVKKIVSAGSIFGDTNSAAKISNIVIKKQRLSS